MNGKANKLPEKKPNIGFWKEYAYKRTCTAVFFAVYQSRITLLIIFQCYDQYVVSGMYSCTCRFSEFLIHF